MTQQDIMNRQIYNGYAPEQLIGHAEPARATALRIEPVQGGFIVADGSRTSVCTSVPQLVKQLRAWGAKHVPKKKTEE